MRVFRRVSQTLSFGIESLLDGLENQEAVARGTIREVEAGAGRVRIRRKATERQLGKLEQREAELARDAELWNERALRLRHDPERALECLRRRSAVLRERRELAARTEAQRALLGRIRADETAIDTKLAELEQREAALVSREARARAESSLSGRGDLDGVFDRWEARVEEHEGSLDAGRPVTDAFARNLADEEEEAALRAELETLLRTEVSS